jgi:excisionase family DNA binding protein
MDSLRDRLLTYQQVAQYYQVDPRTVRRWADKGAIPVVRTPSGAPRVPSRSVLSASASRNSDNGGHSGR